MMRDIYLVTDNYILQIMKGTKANPEPRMTELEHDYVYCSGYVYVMQEIL